MPEIEMMNWPHDYRIFEGEIAWDPPAMATGSQQAQVISIPGIRLGDFVFATSFSVNILGTTLTGEVTSPGVVTGLLKNGTSTALNVPAGVLKVMVLQKR